MKHICPVLILTVKKLLHIGFFPVSNLVIQIVLWCFTPEIQTLLYTFEWETRKEKKPEQKNTSFVFSGSLKDVRTLINKHKITFKDKMYRKGYFFKASYMKIAT